MAIRNFRKLRSYQMGMDLLMQVMAVVDTFPPEETYALAQLLRNAAMAFPAGLARASGNFSRKSCIAQIVAAEGSLLEVDTFLEIAAGNGYISKDRVTSLFGDTQAIRRQLDSLQERVNSRPSGRD
jgi:four helix bundle protein